MGWKIVAESDDLIVLEKELKDSKLKIEARKNEDLKWEVFKTKIKGESANLVSEFTLDDKHEVKKLITQLKRDVAIKTGSSSISMKRAY
ncbi:MAG: hypothetical protein HGA85_09485, partial [Nanoarchaeota archaeon]|nr:hypothetical protein [Nanoarchaeota archaeon]